MYYYVTCSHIQVLIGQIVLFEMYLLWHAKTQTGFIEILIENETTEQINNETAQQVSERNRFFIMFYW